MASSFVTVRLAIEGGAYAVAGACELSAAAMGATNSLARPADECMQTRRLSKPSAAGGHVFPARSVTLLTFQSVGAATGAKP